MSHTRMSLDGSVATLTMNRPDRINALTTQMRAEIAGHLTSLPNDARVVVLTGEGRGFCAGQDLSEPAGLRDLDQTLRQEYVPMLRAIVDCPVPVIAAVNGVAAGAGANIALACDVVIATESALFVQAFSKVALIPDAGGTWFLPRIAGHARAMGMMLFGDKITATQAQDWGMIWQSVPDEQFAGVVAERAQYLAEGPTGSFVTTRKLVRESARHDLEAQLDLEAHFQGEAGRHPDYAEGVAAFREKRRPSFAPRG